MTLLLVVRREIQFLSREFFNFERFRGGGGGKKKKNNKKKKILQKKKN